MPKLSDTPYADFLRNVAANPNNVASAVRAILDRSNGKRPMHVKASKKKRKGKKS